MDVKEQIRELKAEAYDLLALSEQCRMKLTQVNQQIAELSQREKTEALKPDVKNKHPEKR